MTLRESFVEKFGEEDAKRAEAAAMDHKSFRNFDEAKGYGSNKFRWCVLMVISFECAGEYRDHHGFEVVSEDTLKTWMVEHVEEFNAHDGDIDFLALMCGAYGFLGGNKDETTPDATQTFRVYRGRASHGAARVGASKRGTSH